MCKKKNLLTFGCNIYAFLPSLVASDIITSIDWTPEKMTVMNWCLLINIFSVNNIFSEFVMLRLDSAINSLHNKHSPGQYSTTHLIDLMLSHQRCQGNFADRIILRYNFWWLLPRTTTVLNLCIKMNELGWTFKELIIVEKVLMVKGYCYVVSTFPLSSVTND